jgi:hypothetical protein
MSDPFVAQLGRISGHMLTPDLLRDGIDLTFRNNPSDADLLYLNVTDRRIGINTDGPAFDLDVPAIIRSTDADATSATIANLTFNPTSTISSLAGLPINIRPAGNNPTVIFDRMGGESVLFDGNAILSLNDQNIVFNANGVGIIDIQSSARIRENLEVNGSIFIGGNLSTTSNITVGDSPLDIVIINTNLTQDIEPKFDVTYDIGSVEKRWSAAYIERWQEIDNIRPYSAVVNDQMLLGGDENAIRAIQPDQDLFITPDTGVYFIERLRIEDSNILNLDNTTLTLRSTGIGYYVFGDSNAMLIPSGTSAERPSQETGDLRLNTELGHLEVFDGSVYVISIGEGDPVTTEEMTDFGNLYTLILG